MSKQEVILQVEAQRAELCQMADQIWNYAETAMQEFRSSKLQRDYLEQQGFQIREIPDMPTSFIAEAGSGRPIIGILGEYDALPSLSQKVQSSPEVCQAHPDAGHGCGHNLLGTAGVGAAAALKRQLETEQLQGTIRYYGCASEETLSGKPMIARTGVFDDLDAAISWHPTFNNSIWGCNFLAMNSMKFRFRGKPAHASLKPEAGRSALDAVELMNVGANYLREHVPSCVRMHYCITKGGTVPNVVPDDAEVWYMVRAPRRSDVRDVVHRLVNISKGAAMMTETSVSHTLLGGCYDVIPNRVLGNLMQANMELVGPPDFDDADLAFAKEFRPYISTAEKRAGIASYRAPESLMNEDLCCTVEKPLDYDTCIAGSTDVGDVSYIAPFAQMTAACWPVGVGSHTWIASACTGSDIGRKAMVFAGKTLAATAYDMFTMPEKLVQAKAEFERSTKGEFYISAYDEDKEN